MSPQAIVFDFDGVIVNSEPLHLRATQAALGARGIALTPQDYYARYVGVPDAEMFRRIAADHNAAWCSDDLQELMAAKALRFEQLETSEAALVPGAAACIRRMADLAPLAVASGARREEIERLLARAGLLAMFRTIVAAGDTLSGKPAPDPYLEAAARLGATPARAVAIEDTPAGLASARAAGFRTIAITTTFPPETLGLGDVVVNALDSITPDLVRRLAD